MRKEPLEVSREVLHKVQSVLSFLSSDWTMTNERLTRFYGLDDVRGRSSAA